MTEPRLDFYLDRHSDCRDVPSEATMRQWVSTALAGRRDEAELSVCVVDEAEGAEFNLRYRNKPGATNVLSFPADFDLPEPLPLLGDLVICAPIVIREAREQGKDVTAHWCHMLMHGTLHLLGYDHQDELEAEAMEELENELLVSLGFPAPYESDAGSPSIDDDQSQRSNDNSPS